MCGRGGVPGRGWRAGGGTACGVRPQLPRGCGSRDSSGAGPAVVVGPRDHGRVARYRCRARCRPMRRRGPPSAGEPCARPRLLCQRLERLVFLRRAAARHAAPAVRDAGVLRARVPFGGPGGARERERPGVVRGGPAGPRGGRRGGGGGGGGAGALHRVGHVRVPRGPPAPRWPHLRLSLAAAAVRVHERGRGL